MGLLTDFLIATKEDIARFDGIDFYNTFPKIVQAKKVDPIKIGTLEKILIDSSSGELDEPILDFEEQWVYPLKPELVQTLAKLTVVQIAECARKWAETEEWQLERVNENDLIPLLQELAKLATQVNADNHMYLFISL